MLLTMLKKKFVNSLFSNMSIKTRLFLYFLILIIIPASIILVIMYNKSSTIIASWINTSLEKNLSTVESDILKKINTVNEISNYIYLNPELVDILSSEHPSDNPGIITEMVTLDKMLDSYYVSSITKNVLIPKIYMRNRPEYVQYNFSDKVSDLGMIETEKWYIKLPSKTSYSVVGLSKVITPSGTIDTIKIAKKLFGLRHTDIPYTALLTIDIGIKEFNDILDSFKLSKNSKLFILDDENIITLSSDPSLIGTDMKGEKYIKRINREKNVSYVSFVEEIRHIDMLVSYKTIESLQWVIVSLSPLNELYGELVGFKELMYIVLIAYVIVAFLLSIILSNTISSPIRKLVRSMSTIKDGNFDISIEYKRNDEFSYLINTYKKMIHEIKELINKLYISEANKRDAELKALQAQINPHFLYNTLDSINWLAIKHGMTDISTMVTSLSDFFRYNLSRGNDIIPLSDEKRQLESYLTIQKIRFNDKFDYKIDFAPEILEYLTVKLILQPIVENSIRHGIEKIRGKGFVSISASKIDNIIQIIISDNGIGADIDALNSIIEGKGNNNSKSFAIRNVNERIKQYFGNEFGLKFFSNEPSGVTAIIKIPAIKTQEELQC